MAWTGTSNGAWERMQSQVVRITCAGPCRSALEIRADGDWKRALMRAPLPRGMVVIDKGGEFVGVMCPKCGCSHG